MTDKFKRRDAKRRNREKQRLMRGNRSVFDMARSIGKRARLRRNRFIRTGTMRERGR